jgi:putative DNA methylase
MKIIYKITSGDQMKLQHDLHVAIDDKFDEEFADTFAHIESYNKHLFRPNTYLHKWWARRCGSTFRNILKCLTDDEASRDYYSPGGLEGKIILDPMMGGGTTLHEAIRMGANVIGVDLDPIPVLQARASLTDIPLDDLEQAFDNFYNTLREAMAPFYKTKCPHCNEDTEVQFFLYGLRKNCDCQTVLSVDSTILRHDPDGSVIRICPHCYTISKDKEHVCNGNLNNLPLVEKKVKKCSSCNTKYQEDITIPFAQRYVPYVVVGKCRQHGMFFKKFDESDSSILSKATQVAIEEFWFDQDDFIIDAGPKSTDLIRRGISTYLELFSARQLLYLSRAIRLIQGYEPKIKLNLALLISTSLEFNSMLCGYKGAEVRRPGAIRHTFSHHAYSFPHTALENNPLYPEKSSGTLQKLFHDRIRKSRQWAMAPEEKLIKNNKPTNKKVIIKEERDFGIEVTNVNELQSGIRRFMVIQGSSTNLNIPSETVDFVVTDPPYFDSVQYSDLAAFFRVWLRQMLPNEAKWNYNVDESAVDLNGTGNGQYTDVLSGIFIECNRVLKKDRGRLVFTYHHWNPKGWAALTIALKRSNFVLVNRYVVHSENPISVHIANMNSLKHDTILVCAPRQNIDLPKWELPTSINKEDSKKFCHDCGTVLGWMLSSDITEERINEIWSELLN